MYTVCLLGNTKHGYIQSSISHLNAIFRRYLELSQHLDVVDEASGHVEELLVTNSAIGYLKDIVSL